MIKNQIAELEKQEELIKKSLIKAVGKFEENKNIQRVSHKPSIFYIKWSEVSARKNLSPEFHDFAYQSNKIIKSIEGKDLKGVVNLVKSIINEGFFNLGKEKITIHPDLIKSIKELNVI